MHVTRLIARVEFRKLESRGLVVPRYKKRKIYSCFVLPDVSRIPRIFFEMKIRFGLIWGNVHGILDKKLARIQKSEAQRSRELIVEIESKQVARFKRGACEEERERERGGLSFDVSTREGARQKGCVAVTAC